jgi:hypothetical protein
LPISKNGNAGRNYFDFSGLDGLDTGAFHMSLFQNDAMTSDQMGQVAFAQLPGAAPDSRDF